MNFYPQWSTQQVSVEPQGAARLRAVEQDGAGFVHLIEDYYKRYGVPIMVTETSAKGDVRRPRALARRPRSPPSASSAPRACPCSATPGSRCSR